MKEKAIINFAELASERLDLFSQLGDLDPRGQFLKEYTALFCPKPTCCQAWRSILVILYSKKAYNNS